MRRKTRRRGRRGIRTRGMIRTARERIEHLLTLAEGMARSGEVHRMRRCVELAWRISTRYNVRIPRWRKRWICRRCRAYLLPGVTARVRVRGHVRTTCLLCGDVRRIPWSRERKESG